MLVDFKIFDLHITPHRRMNYCTWQKNLMMASACMHLHWHSRFLKTICWIHFKSLFFHRQTLTHTNSLFLFSSLYLIHYSHAVIVRGSRKKCWLHLPELRLIPHRQVRHLRNKSLIVTHVFSHILTTYIHAWLLI